MPRDRSIRSTPPRRAALAVSLAAAMPLLAWPGGLHAQAADPYVPTLGTVHPIDAIDPTGDEDADLEPLIEAIGDARVVVLGEATHSDGAVTAAKARVARFLHERMGFDVLAWESGFLQSHAMNEALRDPDVPLEQAAAYLMAGGWASEVWTRPLFEHARDSWRGYRPLIMAGFDTGRPHRAEPYFRRYLRQVVARAPWLLTDSLQAGLVDSLAVRGFGFLTPEVTPDSVRAPQREATDALLRAVRTRRDSLRAVLSDREIAFLEQTLEHALTSEDLKEARGVERAYGRDRAMAETLRWLLRELYPDRKVIVWAATAHFIRNSHLIRNVEDSTMYDIPYQAGDHLAPFLGDDLYTIAFTTYAGEIGHIFPAKAQFDSRVTVLEPAPSGSLEGRLHALGHAAAFVDLRSARRKPEAPGGTFEALVLGRYRNVAPWNEVLDAAFFIDESAPVRYYE